MKTDSDLAQLFAAFAHPTRIAVLRCLLRHCRAGLAFGALAEDLGLSPSTLKFHLDEMERAGVLLREPAGRSTILRLDLDALAGAGLELARLCCAGETGDPISSRSPKT